MTSGMIGVLAGTATSLVIKGVDLLLAYDKGRRGDSVKDRERLSQDIWKLVAELRNDYDRLDEELQAEREARRKAEEEVLGLTHRVADLQEQVRRQEAKTDKYRTLAEGRQERIAALARVVERLQTRVSGLDPAAPTGEAPSDEMPSDEILGDERLGDGKPVFETLGDGKLVFEAFPDGSEAAE